MENIYEPVYWPDWYPKVDMEIHWMPPHPYDDEEYYDDDDEEDDDGRYDS